MDFRLLPQEGRETIRVDVSKLEPGAFAPGFLLFFYSLSAHCCRCTLAERGELRGKIIGFGLKKSAGISNEIPASLGETPEGDASTVFQK
jgi:hypothetical protein